MLLTQDKAFHFVIPWALTRKPSRITQFQRINLLQAFFSSKQFLHKRCYYHVGHGGRWKDRKRMRRKKVGGHRIKIPLDLSRYMLGGSVLGRKTDVRAGRVTPWMAWWTCAPGCQSGLILGSCSLSKWPARGSWESGLLGMLPCLSCSPWPGPFPHFSKAGVQGYGDRQVRQWLLQPKILLPTEAWRIWYQRAGQGCGFFLMAALGIDLSNFFDIFFQYFPLLG